jgi:hypothetical protein
MLYMFPTILVQLQKQLYKLYIAFTGISQTYGTDIYQMRCTAYKVASEDVLI